MTVAKKVVNIPLKKQKFIYYFLGIVLAIIFYAVFFYNYTGREIMWKIAYFIMYGNTQHDAWGELDETVYFILVLIPLIIFIILFLILGKNKKNKFVFWGFFSVPIIWFFYYQLLPIILLGIFGWSAFTVFD
jgi:hypothetical protein